MTVDIQIDAVSKNVLARSVSLSATANGADRFRVDVLSQNASYRPSLDDEVTLTVDGTRWFGGIITNIRERGAGGPTVSIISEIDATDYSQLAQERHATVDFPSQTLAARLGTIVSSYLSAAGVTLHGSQATGPTLAAVSYRLARIDAILDEIATLAEGWIWTIDGSKVLRMFEPGTVSAPFNITIPATTWYGDLEVEPTRQDYANRVIVDIGTSTEMAEDTAAQTAIGRIVEVVVSAPDTTTDTQAQALADAYLLQRLVTLRRVTYRTRQNGLTPGMTQTINVPERNVNNTYLVTDVVTRWNGVGWDHEVTAVEGLVYQTGWRETWRSMGGGSASAAGISVAGVTSLRFAYPLAGTGSEGVQTASPGWIPATGYSAAAGGGAVQVQINTLPRRTTSATIVARMRVGTSGTSFTARLYDVTDSTPCTGTSSSVTSTTWQTVTWTVTLTSGSHFYELQVNPSTANEPVFISAYLE